MRITIDTKQDSKEEIRKAIELLRSMLEQSGSADMFPNSSGYQDMFGSTDPQPSQPQSSAGSMFDIFSTPATAAQQTSQPEAKPRQKGPAFMGFEIYE